MGTVQTLLLYTKTTTLKNLFLFHFWGERLNHLLCSTEVIALEPNNIGKQYQSILFMVKNENHQIHTLFHYRGLPPIMISP